MENFLHIGAVWLHVLGIALFVGPQFFLAFAWVPASRQIQDLPTRVAAMRTITTRFGWIGGIGLVLILIGGAYLIMTWRDYHNIPDGVAFFDYIYGVVFVVKMIVLVVMIVLVGLHMFVVGPSQVDAMERVAQGEDVPDRDIRRLRITSMSLSITGLILTLVVMGMGVSLGAAEYSIQEF
ncbi:MAG: CopD family protein [Chloroflexi bacterium]|nr:CopD family protein [Chloroflexota bacterium]